MIELREVAHYVSDKIDVSSLKTEEYITTNNMIPNRGGVVDCESLPQASSVTKYEPGDILISNIRPYFKKIWFSDRISGCSNDVIVFRTNNDNWNKKFLYYVLSQDSFFDFMMAGSNGTKMPRGNKRTIPEFLIPDFDIDKQIRISDTLSAYDTLIENNQKQIKLLEEAAERLYREWFVDLRFPGYEDTKIIDGLPEGWKEGVLSEIGVFKRGKTITKAKVKGGNVPVVAGGINPAYYHNESNTSYPVVTVSGSGANAGFTRLYNENIFASDCSFLDIKGSDNLYFIYCFLKDNKNLIKSLQKGSAQPHVYAKDINNIELKIPEKYYLEMFCKYTSDYFGKIKCLQRQINKLEEARDRLLPKLMNGEIDF